MMEKIAKKEKEAAGAKVEEPTGGWLRLVLPKIKSVPAAGKRWKELTEAGVDPEEMAEYLYGYCGASKEQLKRGLKVARHFRNELKPAAAEIRHTADTTERILKDLREIGGIKIHDPGFDRLPSVQRAFADELEVLAPVVNRTMARGVRVEKDGRITSGAASEALSLLVDLVDTVATEPYASIAPLVAAVRGDVNPSYDYIADSLRNAYNRSRKPKKNTKGARKNPVPNPAKAKVGR